MHDLCFVVHLSPFLKIPLTKLGLYIICLDSEFKQLIGNTRIMLAMKKDSNIGNMVVKNKQLSLKQAGTNSQ